MVSLVNGLRLSGFVMSSYCGMVTNYVGFKTGLSKKKNSIYEYSYERQGELELRQRDASMYPLRHKRYKGALGAVS